MGHNWRPDATLLRVHHPASCRKSESPRRPRLRPANQRMVDNHRIRQDVHRRPRTSCGPCDGIAVPAEAMVFQAAGQSILESERPAQVRKQ